MMINYLNFTPLIVARPAGVSDVEMEGEKTGVGPLTFFAQGTFSCCPAETLTNSIFHAQ